MFISSSFQWYQASYCSLKKIKLHNAQRHRCMYNGHFNCTQHAHTTSHAQLNTALANSNTHTPETIYFHSRRGLVCSYINYINIGRGAPKITRRKPLTATVVLVGSLLGWKRGGYAICDAILCFGGRRQRSNCLVFPLHCGDWESSFIRKWLKLIMKVYFSLWAEPPFPKNRVQAHNTTERTYWTEKHRLLDRPQKKRRS